MHPTGKCVQLRVNESAVHAPRERQTTGMGSIAPPNVLILAQPAQPSMLLEAPVVQRLPTGCVPPSNPTLGKTVPRKRLLRVPATARLDSPWTLPEAQPAPQTQIPCARLLLKEPGPTALEPPRMLVVDPARQARASTLPEDLPAPLQPTVCARSALLVPSTMGLHSRAVGRALLPAPPVKASRTGRPANLMQIVCVPCVHPDSSTPIPSCLATRYASPLAPSGKV